MAIERWGNTHLSSAGGGGGGWGGPTHSSSEEAMGPVQTEIQRDWRRKEAVRSYVEKYGAKIGPIYYDLTQTIGAGNNFEQEAERKRQLREDFDLAIAEAIGHGPVTTPGAIRAINDYAEHVAREAAADVI